MTGTTVLIGRPIVGGTVEAEALVTRGTISGWGGMDPMTGVITENGHELQGESFAGRVLVFRGAKGSSAWSAYFNMARLAGVGPAALVYTHTTTKVALGAVVSRIPAVTDLDGDPMAIIRTGDLVRVDGDRGMIEVLRRSDRNPSTISGPRS